MGLEALQVFSADVGIALCDGRVGVSEQLLEIGDRIVPFFSRCRKRVPQHMDTNLFIVA